MLFFGKGRKSTEKKNAIQKFSAHVSPGKVKFFKKYGMDLVMGNREGPWLQDIDADKKLYNLHSNGGVFNLGHRNSEIIQVLKDSLDQYDIGNHHLISKARAELAADLARLMPGDLSFTVFGVSGGEANDLALKVARGYTGRKKIIYMTGGYHGHTGLAIQAGDEKYRSTFMLDDDDFIDVAFGDSGSLEKALDDQVAAVIMESVPATLGIVVPDVSYVQKVRELCTANNTLLIMDEVQTGLGRTGKLWAFEHFDIIPDMVVLGKGLSGGIYPITATVMKRDIEKVFRKDPFIHISTFGGAEPGAMVARKVLEISSQPAFLEHVNHLADLFAREEKGLKERHQGFFVGLRQLGLMMGVELSSPLAGPVLTKTAYDNDLLMVYANNDTRVCQMLPPLVMDEDDMGFVIDRLDKALLQARRLLPLVKLKEGISALLGGGL